MSKPASAIMDLEDRDPNILSQHLQVTWAEVIGEPQGIRSPECAWRLSHQCFHISKNCCYVLLSILLAPISAVCLGCVFACVSFEYIWCLTPCLRVWKITCAVTRNFVLSCSQAIIVPVAEAFGTFWSGFKIRTQMLPEGPDRKEDFLLV